MHWIQQHVLRQLIHHSELRYADIKPKQIEGSLFMYHLRQLKKEGLVEKRDKNYALTAMGRLRADKLTAQSLKERVQPRVLVLVACWDDEKGLLLIKRHVHPVIDMIGFPSLDMALGEQLIPHAEQAFKEETGLQVSLKRRGEGYITLYRDDKAESYVFFHLLEGRNPHGELQPTHETGQLAWHQHPEATDRLIPSMPELLKQLKTSQEPFFVELSYKLD